MSVEVMSSMKAEMQRSFKTLQELDQSQITAEECVMEMRSIFSQLINYYECCGDHNFCYSVYDQILITMDRFLAIHDSEEQLKILKKEILENDDVCEIIFLYEDDLYPIKIQAVHKLLSQQANRSGSPGRKLLKQSSYHLMNENKQTSTICYSKSGNGNSQKQSQRPSLHQSQKEMFIDQSSSKYDFKQFTFEKNETTQGITPVPTELQIAIELMTKCRFENDDMRIEASYKTFHEVEAQLNKLTTKEKLSFDQAVPDYLEFTKDLTKTYLYLQQNLRELNSDGWHLDKDKDGISVKYKFLPNNPSVSILMESVIQVEAMKLAALINETELYPKYIPFCKHASVLKHLTKSIRVCDSQMQFPIIPNRETIFVGEAIDRLNEGGSFILMARSIDKDKEFQKKINIDIPEKSKMVRLQIYLYIFEIQPLTRTSCRVRAVTNCDPQVSMVPTSVLAFIGRKFAFLLFEKIVKYAKNFENSPWYPKFIENKAFYDWVQQKIEMYHQKQEIRL